MDDVEEACILANRLKEDEDFYKSCSETSKIMYKKHYSKDKFINDITPNLIK